jgi:hypothetical protein
MNRIMTALALVVLALPAQARKRAMRRKSTRSQRFSINCRNLQGRRRTRAVATLRLETLAVTRLSYRFNPLVEERKFTLTLTMS